MLTFSLAQSVMLLFPSSMAMAHIVQATCLLAVFYLLQILYDSPLDPTAVHAIDMQCTDVKGVYDVLQQLLSARM